MKNKVIKNKQTSTIKIKRGLYWILIWCRKFAQLNWERNRKKEQLWWLLIGLYEASQLLLDRWFIYTIDLWFSSLPVSAVGFYSPCGSSQVSDTRFASRRDDWPLAGSHGPCSGRGQKGRRGLCSSFQFSSTQFTSRELHWHDRELVQIGQSIKKIYARGKIH